MRCSLFGEIGGLDIRRESDKCVEGELGEGRGGHTSPLVRGGAGGSVEVTGGGEEDVGVVVMTGTGDVDWGRGEEGMPWLR